MLCTEINSPENTLHPVCPSDEGGCYGEEFSLYFWDEEMTPEYDIPPSEDVWEQHITALENNSRLWEKWSQDKHSAASPLALSDAAVNMSEQPERSTKKLFLLFSCNVCFHKYITGNQSYGSFSLKATLLHKIFCSNSFLIEVWRFPLWMLLFCP